MTQTKKLPVFLLLFLILLSCLPLCYADPVLIDNAEVDNDQWIGTTFSAAGSCVGQSFTNLNGTYRITSAQFKCLHRSGMNTNFYYAKLYSHSGVFGTSSVPDILLATSDGLNCSGFTDEVAWTTFTFSGANQYEMASLVNYCIVFGWHVGENSMAPRVDTGGAHAGNWFRNNPAGEPLTWDYPTAWDLNFRIYGELISGQNLAFELSQTILLSANSVFNKELAFLQTNTIQPSDVASMSKAISGILTEYLNTNSIYPTANLLFNKELGFWKIENIFPSASSTMSKALKITLYELFDFVLIHSSVTMTPSWLAMTIDVAVAIAVIALVIAITGIGLVVLRRRRE